MDVSFYPGKPVTDWFQFIQHYGKTNIFALSPNGEIIFFEVNLTSTPIEMIKCKCYSQFSINNMFIKSIQYISFEFSGYFILFGSV